jgi:hypothetical protein
VKEILTAPVEEVPKRMKTGYAEYSEDHMNQHVASLGAPPMTPASEKDKWEQILKFNDLVLTEVEDHSTHWEQADPKHRMGDILNAAWRLYLKANPRNGFFEWLDSIPEWERISMLGNALKDSGIRVRPTLDERKAIAAERKLYSPVDISNFNLKPSVVKAFITGVAYLDAVTRPNYRVNFEGGLANYRGGLLDTAIMQTVFSGSGFGIWVIDTMGNFYAGNHVYGQMHHSSFLAGESIKAGGEVRAENGRIKFLSGKSGHYMPPIANLVGAVRILQHLGVPIQELHVLVFENKVPKAPDGREFLRTYESKPGRYDSWGNLTESHKQWIRTGNFLAF